MAHTTLAKRAELAYRDRKRLIVPLLGFPGISMVGTDIKTAQQNHRMHFRVIQSLVETFKPDLIFPLMDLSVEANALGRYTIFPRNESATVPKDVFHFREIEAMRRIDIRADARVRSFVETVSIMHAELPSSILTGAYTIGPYSLAALIAGAEQAAIATIQHPDDLLRLVEFTAATIQIYMEMLADAGADVICILEPTAVMLSPDAFQNYSGQFVQRMASAMNGRSTSTVYHICGKSMHLVERMGKTGVDALSLDAKEFGVDLVKAVQLVPDSVAIIGNASPTNTMLLGRVDDVRREVNELLEAMQPYPNFILSTGCDLPQDTPLENIHAFMQCGREYRVLN